MRVLHCCLAQFYVDDYSYQENVLPKMHKLQGHEVYILASTETYIGNNSLGYTKAGTYETTDGIKITRIPYLRYVPNILVRKLRIYEKIEENIAMFKPDIIFIHDCQFLSIAKIVDYVRKHRNVTVYVDGHADFINSAKTFVSKHILHKIIYRWCAKKIEPFTKKFYGVLPPRMDFFRDVYKIDSEKIELLHLGADLTIIDLNKREVINEKKRMEYGIEKDDFVIITGGKLDRRKNIHSLISGIHEIGNPKIKLIVFGTPSKEMDLEYEMLFAKTSSSIIYLGWLDQESTNEHLLIADLVFFPGTHSVLWEQSIGLGLPGVFKYWEGMTHLDIGGNCILLAEITGEVIKSTILALYENPNTLKKMKAVAQEKGVKIFSYYEIAKKAIE